MRVTEDMVLFWHGPFSQWHPCIFKSVATSFGIDLTFNCAEQFMMAHKALLFQDQESLGKIMAASSPKEQKRLGREIRGYDDKTWEEFRQEVVYQGNRLKFGQHPELKTLLMGTGDRILAEASPYDLIWGIGYRDDDPRALDQTLWRGQNLLGKALMLVRKSFKEEGHAESAQ